MDWGVFYIIGNILKRRYLKWACMIHLDICTIRYGQKKDQESNGHFDSRPLKVRNQFDFLACKWLATHHWKSLNEGYNFYLNLISIRGLHTKLWAPKVTGIPTLTISKLPLGNPETKCHLDVGLMERHIVYYKGEGGGFPQVWAVLSLVSSNCLWLVLAPKVLQLCTNHFMLVLCRFVWVVEACQFFLVPSWNSNTPLYPSKVLWARERASIPYSSVVFSLDWHLSPSRSWERINPNENHESNFDNDMENSNLS